MIAMKTYLLWGVTRQSLAFRLSCWYLVFIQFNFLKFYCREVLYSIQVAARGGHTSHVKSDDGVLDKDHVMIHNFGNPFRTRNPEQLFAAGYAACFENTVLHVAQRKKQRQEGTSMTMTAKVALQAYDDGHFNVGVPLDVHPEGVDDATGAELIRDAHRVCRS
jgi:osmotically inducible protein OsmC